MPVLKNPKHEAFAQALAKGKTQDEAYAEAGYKPSRHHASRLATKGNIGARLAELLSKVAAKTEITMERLVDMLLEDRDTARACEQAGAAVSATVAIAKLTGHMVERKQVDITHTYREMSDDELDRELARALAGEPLTDTAH